MKTSLFALAIAALAISPAAAQDAPATPPASTTPPAASSGMSSEQMSAQDFADKAGAANMFEVETSKVALQKASNDDIKDFAQQMIDDHTKAGDDLKAAADSQGGITVPTDMDADMQSKLDQLNGASGEDFDTLYIQMQTDAHKDAVALFDDFSKNGEDGAVKDFAGKTLPTLQHHLEMVQGLSQGGDMAAGSAMSAGGAAAGTAAGSQMSAGSSEQPADSSMAPAPDASAPDASANTPPAPDTSNAAPTPPAPPPAPTAAPPAPDAGSPTPPPAPDAATPPAPGSDTTMAPPPAPAGDQTAAPADEQPHADVDMSTLQPVDMATLKGDDLKGMDVVNSEGEKIASVNDFVLNSDGQVDAIIVDFGGFLGIGTKPVAVAFEGANVMGDENNNRYLVVDTTKEQLDAQPAYNKDDYAANRDTQLLQPSK